MLFHHAWVVRALVVHLREPGMRLQRRFLALLGLVFVVFVSAALVYLFRQPNDTVMERAALEILAAMGMLIMVAIVCAMIIRKKTGARWSDEDALKAAALEPRKNVRRR
jgi:ABC-type thiamin/hydroxymethylpyrimidine transport system permease subunit